MLGDFPLGCSQELRWCVSVVNVCVCALIRLLYTNLDVVDITHCQVISSQQHYLPSFRKSQWMTFLHVRFYGKLCVGIG